MERYRFIGTVSYDNTYICDIYWDRFDLCKVYSIGYL